MLGIVKNSPFAKGNKLLTTLVRDVLQDLKLYLITLYGEWT